jgi:hypothetical protein
MKKSIFFAALMMGAFMFTACDKGGTPETDSTKLWPAQEDEGTTWGYFNGKDAKLAVRAKYDAANPFSCGYALVLEETDWKFIDKSGTVVSSKMPELDGAPGDFYFDVCRVTIDGTRAFLDKDFKKLTKQEFEVLGEMTEDGLVPFRFKDETLLGYCDKEGNIVIKAQYNRAYAFADGIAVAVETDEKTGKSTYFVIDTKGKVLFEQKDPLYNLGEGRLAFQNDNGKWGMLDKNGNEIVGATYGSISAFTEGLALVTHHSNGKVGYIDAKGNEVIEPQYEDGYPCYESLIWVRRYNSNHDGKWLLIDKKGNEKFELMKNQAPASIYHNGLACVAGESKYFYLDKNGEEKYSWKRASNGGFSPAPAVKNPMRGTKYGPLFEERIEMMVK